MVGRVAAGVSYLELAPSQVTELRANLMPGAHAELLDRPRDDEPVDADPWGMTDAPLLALTRAVKTRFDPAGVQTNARLGRPTSAGAARIMQTSLRFRF